jgi:hypothetical protein
MEFKRKIVYFTDADGKHQASRKLHKMWMDPGKRYRITWNRQYMGITISPLFQACVRCVEGPRDTRESWDFAGARKPYKTLAKAQQACELNERIWNAVIALNDEKHFMRRLDALKARSVAGTGLLKRSMLRGLPKWVAKVCNPRLLEYLFPSAPLTRSEREDNEEERNECTGTPEPGDEQVLNDLTEALRSLDDDTSSEVRKKTREPGRVLPASDGDKSTTKKTRRTRLKATDTGEPSSAPPVEVPVTAPAKPSRKHTAKSSKRGGRKKRNTITLSTSETEPSKGSRKRKSKPSRS